MKLVRFQCDTPCQSRNVAFVTKRGLVPIASQGCLSIPGFKGPSAAHAGAVAPMGLCFEAVQLLHPVKSTTEPHTPEQPDSLAPRGQRNERSCHTALLKCGLFSLSFFPASPLLPRILVLCSACLLIPLEAEHCYPLGIQIGRSFPEVAQAAGKGDPTWFLQLAPGSVLCLAVLLLQLAGGDSQDSWAVWEDGSLQAEMDFTGWAVLLMKALGILSLQLVQL